MWLLAPSVSSFCFPSLALIFTASFSVYMPERLKEAKHLLPLPPRVLKLFTQPHSFLLHHMRNLPPGWDARVLPESLLLNLLISPKQKRWILTQTHLLTTRGLPSPKWRFDGGCPNKVDHGIVYSPARAKPIIFIFLPFSSLFFCQTVFWWSACLYLSL